MSRLVQFIENLLTRLTLLDVYRWFSIDT